MKRKTKHILIAAGAATAGAALFTAAYAYTLGRLMKVALDRELPQTSASDAERLSGSSGVSETIEFLNERSKELESLPSVELTLTADDGTILVGHWIEAKNTKRIIVAMHGWRSSWSKDFALITDFWLKNGCSILFAEQRGQGKSGGDFMGFGLLERFDCKKWAEFVAEKTNNSLPIYLCGISMGATTVLMTAGSPLPSSVCGVIADCGFTSPHAIWKHVAESNLHLPYGLYGPVANDICRRKINLCADEYSTPEALKSCTLPVLFIHGTDDHFVPVEMTFENYKACTSPKRLFVVPGAEHGMSYLVDKAGYEKTMTDFWSECDGRPSR